MIDLKHTGPDSYRGIIWEPQRGETIVAPGFNPGYKRKAKSVLAPRKLSGFDGEAENRDKT